MDNITTAKVKDRYNKESTSCSNLSCGGNLSYLNPVNGEKILDMGCGRGLETIEAARLVMPNGFVVGIDLSDKMVSVAKENARIEDIKNVEFKLSSILKMPFENESIDGIISNCVINHEKDKTSVYKEIFRVLKANGRFVISDAVTKTRLPLEISEDPEAIADCFGGAIPYDDYMRTITEVGFTKVEVLKKREYIKNGYDFMSITIRGYK